MGHHAERGSGGPGGSGGSGSHKREERVKSSIPSCSFFFLPVPFMPEGMVETLVGNEDITALCVDEFII